MSGADVAIGGRRDRGLVLIVDDQLDNRWIYSKYFATEDEGLRTRFIPAVAVTAHVVDGHEAAGARSAGFDTFCRKPCRPLELLRAIRDVLDPPPPLPRHGLTYAPVARGGTLDIGASAVTPTTRGRQ